MVKEILIKGLTIDEFVKKETEAREVHFWGKTYIVVPALVSDVHGDGLQIVYLSSIDTRPWYYVLRIDSSINLDDDDSLSGEDKCNYGCIYELLLQMAEEEFDNIDRYKENKEGLYYDPDDEEVEPFEYKWPMVSWGGGSWGLLANFKTKEIGRL